MVATIGENRKMLVFPLEEVQRDDARQGRASCSATRTAACPTCACSKKDGPEPGSTRPGRTFTLPMSELKDWVGQRAQAGRLAPRGFPKSNKFGPAF